MRHPAVMVLLVGSSTVLFFVVSAGVVDSAGIPSYIDCVSSDDCGTSECCVLGVARYSIPSCRSRGEAGDPCNPLNEPRNMSVSYLDGSVVQLVNVFSTVCSCAPGLVCSRDSGMCVDPITKQFLNDLDD